VGTASSIQSVNFSSTVAVDPGVYWAAVQFSAAASVFATGSGGYMGNTGGGTQGAFTIPSTLTIQGDTTETGALAPVLQVF